MFERFTERARRVIFFARYEASQYGSSYIETEHLLLGWLREDRPLAKSLFGHRDIYEEIRAEIEKRVSRRQRISTSVELPLTAESKKILTFAAEESQRLGHRHVGTEHFLLGMLRVEGSLAAQLLLAKGLKTATVREQLAKTPGLSINVERPRDDKARLTLDSFLAGLKSQNADDLIDFFSRRAYFVDVFGKRWTREEIYEDFETLFAPYAKKNATPIVEETLVDGADLFVASVVWKNAILASQERIWIHRMSVVLLREGESWGILLLHVTPVQSALGQAAQSGQDG